MNLKSKIVGSIVMVAFFVAVIAPVGAYAHTNVTIKNNGSDSVNKVKIKKAKKNRKNKRLRQRNKTAVVNLTGVMQNTGNNSANKNTGKNSDVDVDSGKTTATVTNKTTTKGNTASVVDCGCESDDKINVTIKGNGSDSKNKVKIYTGSGGGSSVKQSNKTFVLNGTYVGQNTGGNSANKNTGGTVNVNSGDASATVTNTTVVGGNMLN